MEKICSAFYTTYRRHFDLSQPFADFYDFRREIVPMVVRLGEKCCVIEFCLLTHAQTINSFSFTGKTEDAS
jgi:hypothetical protein